MSVIHVTESDEFQKLISSGVALVDFSASWCGPCKRVEPVFKELAKENPTVKFIHVDVDEACDTMPNELENVSGVPHFELFHNGSRISQFAGANLTRIRESVKILKSKLETPKVEEPQKEEVKKEESPKDEQVKEEPKNEENKNESASDKKDEAEKKPEEENNDKN